jgi:CHAT domain-containing protein/Tfp pilus assembly protein PilF
VPEFHRASCNRLSLLDCGADVMVARWSYWVVWIVVETLLLGSPIRAQTETDRIGAEAERLLHAGKYAEAIPLAERTLALIETALGPEHPSVATWLNNLTELYGRQGRYGEAETLARRSLAIFEKALGPEHPEVATSLNNLALTYVGQGRTGEAETLLKRSLAMRERALGPEHLLVAESQGNLAEVYREQGRYGEAEPLYKRSLETQEKALGPAHPDATGSLNNLALLYLTQGRNSEAETLLKRGLETREKTLGPEHPSVAESLINLAEPYRRQGRYGEAEPLLKRSVAILEKALGPEHPWLATALNNLALLYENQGRYGEAETLYKRSLATREKALGSEHPAVALSLNNLAELYRAQSRYGEAEPLYKRSLAIFETALGPEHPSVATSLSNLAWLALAQADLVGASELWRRATVILQRRVERGLGGNDRASEGEAQQSGTYSRGLIKTVQRLADMGKSDVQVSSMEMFQIAQWVGGSEAATSLAQMAARSAVSSPELGALARERQDLIAEWRSNDKQLITARSEPPAERRSAFEKKLTDRIAAIDKRLAAIDARLAVDFPDYAALAGPKPIAAADVQTLLRNDEALVLFLNTAEFKPLPEETYIWVVTKGHMRWVKSDLGTRALTREVAALRCGLDSAAWDGADRCGKLLGVPPEKAPTDKDQLPFDLARAHALYKALFGKVEDLIKGKDLLLVPSGPLTQLPFQVLVTAPPGSRDLRSAAWLARSHALTVLPAASSLKALRRVAKPSAANKPIIGFGNPLLEGDQTHNRWGDYYKRLARLARDKQRCDQPQPEAVATLRAARKGTAPSAMRGGHVDLADIKMQTPLPETADELCAVGRALGADATDLLIGARASETAVKVLSANGALAQYRIVHFATHGALAGQLLGTNEPGLILTPPAAATEDDDGYLSASEVATLKLDADWVILSACNTAAGGADSAEAMSGLARAFFYAQARALLVSHWAVESNATVKLVTNAVTAASDPKIGRAEALRRAMLALIDRGTEQEAHPSYWAPFVLVGEGAAAR